MTVDEWVEWARHLGEWTPVVREGIKLVERQQAEIEQLKQALRAAAPPLRRNAL